MIAAFRQFIGRNAMLAYLAIMTPRLVELRRVLKPTGSLYLHCDPTASHYLSCCWMRYLVLVSFGMKLSGGVPMLTMTQRDLDAYRIQSCITARAMM